MEEIYIQKLTYHKWYVRNVTELYEIGRAINTKSSGYKDTWIHECKEKRTGRATIMKTIKRKNKEDQLKDICNQLFELQVLHDSIENKGSLGKIFCFDWEIKKLERDSDEKEIIVRVVMEKCNGTLKQFISQNQKMKPAEFVEQVKYFTLMMFELEGRGINHKNLTINNIYYTFDSTHKIIWKVFGFASFIWDAADGSLFYASPEEKFYMSRFQPGLVNGSYELDYFKIDTFNLGITFLEMITMKEIQNWGFYLDSGDDPKRRDEYVNQGSLNSLLTENSGYLNNYKFLFPIIKSMIHVNPIKRDRFTRVINLLHEGFKLKLLAYQLDPLESMSEPLSNDYSEEVFHLQTELTKCQEEVKKLVKKSINLPVLKQLDFITEVVGR